MTTNDYNPQHNTTVYQVPLSVREMITPNAEDDGYTVYIDENLSDEERLAAYEHALRHIQGADFEKPDVQEIEAKAHAPEQPKPKNPKAQLKPRNRRRPLTPEEYERLGIPPELAEVLRLTKIDAPALSRKTFQKIHEEMNR